MLWLAWNANLGLKENFKPTRPVLDCKDTFLGNAPASVTCTLSDHPRAVTLVHDAVPLLYTQPGTSRDPHAHDLPNGVRSCIAQQGGTCNRIFAGRQWAANSH
jgi:hypothetical protein